MKYYLVGCASEEQLVLEDLSLENRDKKQRIIVKRDCKNKLCCNEKSAKILKKLPDNFKLSQFNDGNGRFVLDGEKILYDLTSSMVDFTDDMTLEEGSIIGVSDWE